MIQCMNRCPQTVGFLSFPHSYCPQNLSTLPPGVLEKPLMYCSCTSQMGKMNMSEMEVAFLKKFQEWNSINFAYPLHSSYPHGSADGVVPPCTGLLLQQIVSISMLIFPCARRFTLQLNCVLCPNAWRDVHELWVFSLFFILTQSPKSEYTASRFFRKSPYVLPLCYSNVEDEYVWNGKCFSGKVSKMEFKESVPIISSPHTHFSP